MSRLILFVVVVLLGYPLFYYEWTRYYHLYHQSIQTYMTNQRILNNELCRNALERLLHGDKVNQMCQQAQYENKLTPRLQAFQMWWRTSEWVALYYRVAGSTWALMGLIMFSVVVFGYFVTRLWLAQSRDRYYFNMLQDAKTMYLDRPRRHHSRDYSYSRRLEHNKW